MSDAAVKAKAPAGEGGLPLARAIGTRNLLIIIVTMPLFFLLVVVGIVAAFGDDAPDRVPAAETARAPFEQRDLFRAAVEPARPHLAPPKGAELALPAGADILHIAIDGPRMSVLIRDGAERRILFYDVEKGVLTGVLPVAEAAPEPGL